MFNYRSYLIPCTIKAIKAARYPNNNIRKVIEISNKKTINSTNVIINRFYSQNHGQKTSTVDFKYVRKATENREITLIDVREPSEIQELGQIPNSINIPLGSVSSVLSTMSENEFENVYGRKKPNKNNEIIFYCKLGGRSEKAQKEAINLGYKNVKNYPGSYTDWVENVNK